MPCPSCPGGTDLSPEKVAALAGAIPLAPGLGAPEPVRERRLGVCAGCEALRGGVMCAWCGCFVLFRSRIAAARCPHPEGDKWPAG